MAKDKRVEVLFEPSEYKVLEDAAHRQGKSVGAMVREAVVKYVTGPSEAERRAAFDDFMKIDGGPAMDPDDLSEFMARTMYEAIIKGMPGYDPDIEEQS